jgi:signal transduction histidine kinase
MDSTENQATGVPRERIPECVELGLLTTMVCHYLINSFAGVVSHLELLSTLGDSAEESKKAVGETIVATAMHAASVARQLSGFASGLIPRYEEPVRLDELIAAAVARRQARDPSTRWRLEASEVPPLPGNPELLAWMFDAILENSQQAATEAFGVERLIEARVYVRPDHWICVEISGPGLPLESEAPTRAFEPFFSTRKGQRGVGLTLAKSIWRRHHGSMTLRPRDGGGAVLTLRVAAPLAGLPANSAAATTGDAPATS